MPRQFIYNNAQGTLSVAVSSDTQATLTLQTGEGALFPSPVAPDFFFVTLDDGTNVEICRCIARSGDALTVLRGIQDTTAQSSFATGTKVQLRITADTLDKITQRGFARYKYIRPAANVSSWQVMGATLLTNTNSSVAATLTNSSVREYSERIRAAQANSAQNPIGHRLAQPTMNGYQGYRYMTRFGFATAPNSSHFFIGLVNTTGAFTSVHPPSSLINAVVVGYAAGALGSNLSIWRNDGSGNAVQLDLGSYFTVRTDAWYEFELEVGGQSGRVDYWVRRLDISSIAPARSYFTSDIPPGSLWLNPYMWGSTMVTSQFLAECGGHYWES